MYSRYMRSGGLWEEPEKPKEKPPEMPSFTARHSETPPSEPRHEPPAKRERNGLLSLFKNGLGDIDLGDLLLIAIIIFLLVESDDIEIIIALVLLLLGGL